MRPLKPEEEWVRRVIARALGVAVVQHDDGSRERMYDLTIMYTDRPAGAVEVTSAADGEMIALWKLLNRSGERWVEGSLVGGWLVEVSPSARGKRIRRELPRLLRTLEESGVTQLDVPQWGPRPEGPQLLAQELGITWMQQSATDFPGSIYCVPNLPPERSGGVVASTGDALALWVGEFLATERADVGEKLVRSGAAERHAVVILPGFAATDFAVTDVLMRDDAPLPKADPHLPPEVTHLWAMSSWSSGQGMRWSPGSGWAYFEKEVGSAAENGSPLRPTTPTSP